MTKAAVAGVATFDNPSINALLGIGGEGTATHCGWTRRSDRSHQLPVQHLMILGAMGTFGAQQVCAELAYTGQPVTALLVFGAVCLTVGVLLVVLSRGRRTAMRSVELVVLLALGIAVGPGDPPAARAGGPEQACVEQQSSAGNPESPHSPQQQRTTSDAAEQQSAPDSEQQSVPAAPEPDSMLRIVQTSVNSGMGPDIPPSPITGLITG